MNCLMQVCRLCTSDKNVSFTIHNLDSDGKCFVDKLEAIVPEIVDCKIKLPNGICTICAVQLDDAYRFIKQCFDSQIILKQHLNAQLCRLCASNQNISLTLNSMASDNILISYKLKIIASEILECNEKLSNKICSICAVRLNETYKFREKCFKSQEIFKQYIKRKLQNNHVIKNEIREDRTSSCLNEKENNSNFETVYIKEEIIDEEAILPGLENNINIKVEESYVSENNTNFETVYIKKENIKEDYVKLESENNTNIKVEKCLESDKNKKNTTPCIKEEIINDECSKIDLENNTNIKMEENLHSELIIKDEDISEPENETDSKTYQTKKNNSLDVENNYNNEIYFSEEPHTKTKLYKCKICEKTFTENGSLKVHIRSHTEDRPYVCKMCGKAFIQSAHLKTHVSSHVNDRPYKCKMCNKAFTQSTSLTRHIRSHTNEKPYACELCKKAFSQSGDLSRHIRSIHTQERPYECKLCDKAFSMNETLRRHVLSHTQEKRYKCEICGRAFTANGNLKRHIRSHTKKGPSN